MAPRAFIALLVASAALIVAAKDVPDNLAALLNNIKAGGPCQDPLPGSFHDKDNGKASFHYCNDHADQGTIYLKGPSDKLANMDVDCDGNRGPNSACTGGGDTQSKTRFRDDVKAFGISDLDASIHNYVVFGNENSPYKAGYATLDPMDYDIQPLSIIAVVCDNKLFYGIWGDTNGNDGPHSVVGEASLSFARLCFGNGMTEDAGHDAADVLYIAFKGKDAVPGENGAAWKASSSEEFQDDEEFNKLGDELVSKIQI